MFNLYIFTTYFVLFLKLIFINAFNLYIESDEMNRTLGISAQMDYITNGVINEYSTKFPYRLAENISRLRFTWSSPERMAHYSLQAVSQHFDVVPIILLPTEGYVPRIPQQFQVEYRCVGAHSGQFRVLLHFNITTKTSLQLTLKQEKICLYREGRRRAFTQEEYNNHYNINNIANNKQTSSPTYSTWPLFSFLSFLSLPCQLLVASVSLFALVCSVLLCCCYCIKEEENQKINLEQQTNNFSRRRRSKIGSLYNSTRSSLIRRKILFQQGIEQKNKLNGSLKENSADKSGLSQITTTGQATINSTTTQAKSSKTDDEQRKPLLDQLNDPQMPSTSAAALKNIGGNNRSNRIIYEHTNQVDVNQALVELNADRNLFEQCHKPELEGEFGQLIYANWRQVGQHGDRPVVDEVDDGEDDAKEDTALICKTLKPDADRIQFESFLRSALQFHYVIAAATFGNFLNPESVRDLPLICYAHDGFGILKCFLHECREQAINASILNIKKTSSVSPSVVVKGWAKRFRKGSNCSNIGIKEDKKGGNEDIKMREDSLGKEKGAEEGNEYKGNPRIGIVFLKLASINLKQVLINSEKIKLFQVVTNTPSSSSSTIAATTTSTNTETTTTTLRTHNLVLLASQIVSAVRHLHKFGIIHKDIATRNCLISRIRINGGGHVRLHAQLCDSALGSDLFPEDYKKEEKLQENELISNKLPVRWMAPELFNFNKKLNLNNKNINNNNYTYNSATDIWACGILIWELFTCGKLPYSDEVNEDELEQAIVYAGLRLSQPYNCPDELYSIMCSCWSTIPENRPTASELDLKLQDFMQRLSKYI